jgi:hypothetical protein
MMRAASTAVLERHRPSWQTRASGVVPSLWKDEVHRATPYSAGASCIKHQNAKPPPTILTILVFTDAPAFTSASTASASHSLQASPSAVKPFAWTNNEAQTGVQARSMETPHIYGSAFDLAKKPTHTQRHDITGSTNLHPVQVRRPFPGKALPPKRDTASPIQQQC